MGYESRIYVVSEYKFDYGNSLAYNWDKPIETESGITHEPYRKSDGTPMVYTETVAMFNLCKCGNLFEVFKEEADGVIYEPDSGDPILEDKYGKRLTSADISDVVKWVESERERDDYWRLAILGDSLKSLMENGGSKLKVYHYGY